MALLTLIWISFILNSLVSAQFGNIFEQLFSGGQRAQQQQAEQPSTASRLRAFRNEGV
jgi:hypothetical protein